MAAAVFEAAFNSMATEHQVGELVDGVFVCVCEEGEIVDGKQFMPWANMLACSRLLHRARRPMPSVMSVEKHFLRGGVGGRARNTGRRWALERT